MSPSFWPLVGLAAFDVFLLVICYFSLRASAALNRRTLIGMATGMLGFVFHAFLFFSGAFLFLQLATIGSLVGLSWLAYRKQIPAV